MKRLKQLRENRGITVKELAAELEISTSTIYNWENTDTFPQVSELNELSKLLHVTVDYLIENTDDNLYCDKTVISRVFVAAQIKLNHVVLQTTSQVLSLNVPLIKMEDAEIMNLLKRKIKERLDIQNEGTEIEIVSLVELSPITMSSYAFPQLPIFQ